MQNLNQLMNDQVNTEYVSTGGIEIYRTKKMIDGNTATDHIRQHIDHCRGALYSSRYEYPGRYSRWDVGFIHPPLVILAKERQFTFESLNARGDILITAIYDYLSGHPDIDSLELIDSKMNGEIIQSNTVFPEEERSQQPSIFTVIRAVRSLFESEEDSFLGLYGAFGYDLILQFESIEKTLERDNESSDLVLYLPDEIVVVDHQANQAYQLSYDFRYKQKHTKPYERLTDEMKRDYTSPSTIKKYEPGRYTNLVHQARNEFKAGNMFEVVPSQTLYESCVSQPSEVFDRLQEINPSPYGFIINLGDEHLVGSSPEMYVRVEGTRVETCPISGTIKRGSNAIEDAEQIRKLLNSKKDEEELTMCTDVDRNDKSRICIPGSVNVVGRRQIEMYSHLIHTVDHVEGYLRPEYDALDAFLTHMWAVTVTGAPKKAAIKWIEDHEDTPRGWYGGAVGWYSFNGDLNTGLTLRTIRLKEDVAEVRVGATLLYDSIPEDEEEETLTKAAGLRKAILETDVKSEQNTLNKVGINKKILIVDHEDSFVHTLGNYFKQTGANVITMRAEGAKKSLIKERYDLVVLSPGPGRPEQFGMNQIIELALRKEIPMFGVCLGFQGIVEYFDGQLGLLDYPQHGKTTEITQNEENQLFNGLPEKFSASRYHSIYAETIPDSLVITGMSHDQIVMAVEHEDHPIYGVQFHPESIVSSKNNIGLQIIFNVMNAIETNSKKIKV
ncbi:anthranilate synthase component I [Pseudalkalibacillus berkeleyi]|uniref:Anthranilate synthase n=1 Tax=Pseudalkalibacillus berkeleyi TaxID=1069813 RepID=A0ABS9H1B0_9BACL|nr:anthranilate synthase component I [Pseudalkalibacillus berkeleyi]MCF6137440.1 anthranilate synthase component I [Pseudalkalibacillus berkeleyi]